VDFQFSAMQRFDFSVALVQPSSPATLPALARLPGVLRAEPYRSVAVRLVHGSRSRRVAIMGLPSERHLLHLLDADARPVALPEQGLLLSEKLAELLGVARGDIITVEVLEGGRPVRELVVAETLRDYSGLAAYMALADVNRFMREGDVISGAFLLVDPASITAVYEAVKKTPRIAAASSQAASLRSFQETFSENLLRMRLFNVAFAGIMAFGVVYNAARITLAERAREMATLRVIGLTRAEVSAILLGEIGVLTLVAIPIGLVLGYWLSALAVWGLETETQRFPLVIAPATYGMAALTILVAAAVSCLVVRRRVDRLDLIAVLKSHD
jgi:putative ABC transport system permease protein